MDKNDAGTGPCETCGEPGTCLFRWAGEAPPGRPFCNDCCEHDGGCTLSPGGQEWAEELRLAGVRVQATADGRRTGFRLGLVVGFGPGILLGAAAIAWVVWLAS